MTFEKLIFITAAILFYIFSISIFRKSIKTKGKGIFSSSIISMGLGLCALLVVYLVGLFGEPILKVNFCTALFSTLGSVPGVITMLFLNII